MGDEGTQSWSVQWGLQRKGVTAEQGESENTAGRDGWKGKWSLRVADRQKEMDAEGEVRANIGTGVGKRLAMGQRKRGSGL